MELEPKKEAYYCKYTEDYQICRRCPDIDDPGRPSGTFLDSGGGGLNVSPMSPKLFLSYPHREEYREINLATLFL